MNPSIESAGWRMSKPRGRMIAGRRFAGLQKTTVETDAYLWSLADLMTLLLIFFIMLYSNAIQRTPAPAVKPPLKKAATAPSAAQKVLGVFPPGSTKVPVVKKASAGEQARRPDPPAPAAPVAAPSPPADPLSRQMISDLKGSFSKDFYVRWEDRRPIIVLGERITFNVGQAQLLPKAQNTLKRVAKLITRMDGCRVVVSGHTDDLPIRTRAFPSNWELSAARAASVAKALMADGVAPGRLTIQGLSQFKPLVANTNAENRRINRRVEISLITAKHTRQSH
jgi:chemotaxis protein MotB